MSQFVNASVEQLGPKQHGRPGGGHCAICKKPIKADLKFCRRHRDWAAQQVYLAAQKLPESDPDHRRVPTRMLRDGSIVIKRYRR